MTASFFSEVISPTPQPIPTLLSCSPKKPLISLPIWCLLFYFHQQRRHVWDQHLTPATLLAISLNPHILPTAWQTLALAPLP